MDFTTVVNSSTVYGGGGFLYDTSLDGADSIEITGLSLLPCPWQRWQRQLYLSAEVLNSTVYGGQGTDLVNQSATTTVSNSWIAGNLGGDSLMLSAGTVILNSTILVLTSLEPFLVAIHCLSLHYPANLYGLWRRW